MALAASQHGDKADPRAALRAWQALRASTDIQFAPVPPKPPAAPPPGWLTLLGNILRAIFEPIGRVFGLSWPVLEKVLLVFAVLLAIVLLWRLLSPWLASRRRGLGATPQADWAPDRSAALALLADADRLARDGRFAEAVHLLLRRSVRQIEMARPEWLRPASTAREIAALTLMPQAARAAFALLAARVERSRFAQRELDSADWNESRAAYAEFALAELRR